MQDVSLRNSVKGALNDFIQNEKRKCAYSNDVISGFIGILNNYKEEGVEFNPLIIFLDDIQKFSESIPNSALIKIGQCTSDENSAKIILKNCASLNNDFIYTFVQINEKGDNLEYGVIYTWNSPTSLSIDEVLQLNSENFAVLIKNNSSKEIMVIGSKGGKVLINTSILIDVDKTQNQITNFSKDIVIDINENKNFFEKYISDLLIKSISSCHGTILICSQIDKYPTDDHISDHIDLNPVIDIYEIFNDFYKNQTGELLLRLQRAEQLLKGFLSSDGMIMFTTTGKIIAYKIFCQTINDNKEKNIKTGGARKRAFESLISLKCKDLKSVLFRSQDGATIYEDVSQ